MKLYEFTYNDNTNMPESNMLDTLKNHLAEEAIARGWAPGYNLRQCQIPKQLENGEKEYFFVVEGEVSSGVLASDESSASQTSSLPKRDVAASP